MRIMSQRADSKPKEDSMAEIVAVLVAFEPSLRVDDLVGRLRDLIGRVPDQPLSKHFTTVDSLARMSFDFENVKVLKFTMMCVEAKKLSNTEFAKEQERRRFDRKITRAGGKRLTWFAEEFAQAEAKVEGRNADLAQLRFKWGRYLS